MNRSKPAVIALTKRCIIQLSILILFTAVTLVVGLLQIEQSHAAVKDAEQKFMIIQKINNTYQRKMLHGQQRRLYLRHCIENANLK